MKLRKKKKNVKGLIFKLLIAIIVILSVAGIIYYFLTVEDEDNNLTLLEKQWVESNKSVLVDINVPNDTYIYAKEGDGVIFDFLDYVTESVGLSFNKMPYNYTSSVNYDGLSIALLKPTDAILDNDTLMLADKYVVLGKTLEDIKDISELSRKNVGILKDDETFINTYLQNKGISLKTYDNTQGLITDLNNASLSYIILPRYSYLDVITNNSLYANYVIGDLEDKYVLRLGNNEKLNTIIEKLLNNYKENKMTLSFDKNLLKFYSANKNFTEISKSTLNKRVYKYGFTKDNAYNTLKNNKLYGIAGKYIETLINMTDIEFEYIEYKSVDELKKALDSGKLDMAYVDFAYDNSNYLNTNSAIKEEFACLANKYYDINNKYGLVNNKLYLMKDGYLYDYVSKNINSSIKTITSYNKQISSDGIILLDKNDYLLLKDDTLKQYKYLFSDSFIGANKFVVKQSEDVLYNLIDFVLYNTNYDEYKIDALNELINVNETEGSFKGIYMIVVGIILCPIIIIFAVMLLLKNSKNVKITKKENVLRYNDMLTNLKNRNYLNDNINNWDNTKIYPRTIVMIDLNNLKYVNDNYGHEEGNELIKKAAAILINNQLEKSDIIRTDGNEFLIYLIGYSKTQINSYLSKLSKEFDKLPYGFGAAIGYSMIDDEIKTVDDAINEATIEMRMDKEKNYR